MLQEKYLYNPTDCKERERRLPSSRRSNDSSALSSIIAQSSVRIKVNEGSSLESTLRSISAHLKPREADVKLSEVTKTKEGDLLFKVRELTPGGGALFAEIIHKDSSMEVEVRDASGPITTVILRDIDPPFNAKPIEQYLKAVLGSPDGYKIKTEDPHFTKYRWKRLDFLPHPIARELLERNRIQLGNTWCRLGSRSTPTLGARRLSIWPSTAQQTE